MNSTVILTVAGSDRPGLTQAVAAAVLAAGGNWLESRLSRLGDRYVGSVLVEVAAEKLADLVDRLGRIDSTGLSVTLVPASAPQPPVGTGATLSLVGNDRPGIVQEITALLAEHGANIEDFESDILNGAWSGERMFRAEIRLRLPPGTAMDTIRDALHKLSGDLMVDIDLSPA